MQIRCNERTTYETIVNDRIAKFLQGPVCGHIDCLFAPPVNGTSTPRGQICIFTIMDSAPWFGPAVLAGAFAILGALIGLTATWLSDRRKFRREDERRFHDVVRQTGALLITQLLEARQQLRIAQRLPESSPDRQLAFSRKTELVRAARGSQDSLKFVASREVNDRALDLIQAIDRLTESSSRKR